MTVDMADSGARRDLYEQIYAAGKVIHPRKGVMHPYGTHTDRDALFLDFLARRLPVRGEPRRALDASAGRGHLAYALAGLGHVVEATEYVPSALEALRVPPLAAKHLLAYGELGGLPAKSFDAVISNDVLEHLPAEEAKPALKALAVLSRRFLLVSVGLGHGAKKYPEALGLGKVDLHLHCPGVAWWRKAYGEVARAEEIRQSRRTLWIFGEVL